MRNDVFTDEVTFYVPGIGHSKYKISSDLMYALHRAKAWFQVDKVNMLVRISSRNSNEPLTDIEKERLKFRLKLEMCPYEVVFDN